MAKKMISYVKNDSGDEWHIIRDRSSFSLCGEFEVPLKKKKLSNEDKVCVGCSQVLYWLEFYYGKSIDEAEHND